MGPDLLVKLSGREQFKTVDNGEVAVNMDRRNSRYFGIDIIYVRDKKPHSDTSVFVNAMVYIFCDFPV